MAQFLYKTVATSGGDYTTLEACMNDNEQDLTGDGWFDVEITGTWATTDSTSCTVHNYTTTSSDYINIFTSGNARHSGVFEGYRLSIGGGSGDAINIRTARYITLDGLCISVTGGGTNRYCIYLGDYNSCNAIIKNCIIKSTLTDEYSDGRVGIRATNLNAGSDIKIFNNIIYGFYRTGETGCLGMNIGGSGTKTVYSNTVVSCSTGINNNSVTKNNICYANPGADFSGSVSSGTTSNNLSSDATSPDADYRSKTLTFSDFANADFALISTDTDAIDNGADLGVAYNIDIIGTSRPQGAAWDIGAFEYIGSSPTTSTGFMSCMKGYW